MIEATKRGNRHGRRNTLMVAVCIFVGVSGTLAVAAGGVGAMMGWFAIAKVIEPDGTKTSVEITPDGTFMIDETHGYQVSPESLDKGQTIMIYKAPADAEPSGLTTEEQKAKAEAALERLQLDSESKK